MKKFLSLCIVSILTISCSSDDQDPIIDPIDPISVIPTVSSEGIYDVTMISDIKYAEGLSHEGINSVNSASMPLELDLYVPTNNSENRPVFMFIHGGGFIGGDKQGGQILTLANYYTARGFVFASINYRLRDDFGTVPQPWETYASLLDPTLSPQYLAIYPAQRDAKAALRWIVANADNYNINTDYITVGGGSAGAITAITLGISNEEDFRDEIDTTTDPTLTTTNLEQSYQIQTIVDFWGSDVALDSYEEVYGVNRFDSNDPALCIIHGTEDLTVPYFNALELKNTYEINNVPFILHTLEGEGHAAWGATLEGKSLSELSFDFIVAQQNLQIEQN